MMKKNSKKKSKKEEKKEDSKLEEEISEEEIENVIEEIAKENVIEEKGIDNFLLQIETKAPVLEKIASEEAIIPMQSQFETTQQKSEIKMDYASSSESKYSGGRIEDEDEKKYETNTLALIKQGNFDNQQDIFIPREKTWEQTRQVSEIPKERITREPERQQLPFEEEQKKYKEMIF